MTFYRKDHVHCTQGASLLGEHRLKPESPTRRIVASCCNTAMFLDFTKGHWISIYRERLPLERTVVDRKSGLFVLRLVWAWAQMGFRTPTITYVKGKINAIPS